MNDFVVNGLFSNFKHSYLKYESAIDCFQCESVQELKLKLENGLIVKFLLWDLFTLKEMQNEAANAAEIPRVIPDLPIQEELPKKVEKAFPKLLELLIER